MTLQGKVAIVTGSTEGIGFAITQELLRHGACVVISGRDRKKMATAISNLSELHPDKIHAVIGDVKSPDVRCQLVDEAQDKFKRLDILVNNAGGGSENRWIEDIDDEDLRNTLAFNLESAFALCRLVVPVMQKQNFGRIINISSVAGRDAGRLSGPQYAAAKAGMLGMTRHLARDLGPLGITVNSVAPGLIMTERALRKWEQRTVKERKAMIDGVPIARFGTPEEIAAAVIYFASKESSYTNGACLDVNGGSFFS